MRQSLVDVLNGELHLIYSMQITVKTTSSAYKLFQTALSPSSHPNNDVQVPSSPHIQHRHSGNSPKRIKLNKIFIIFPSFAQCPARFCNLSIYTVYQILIMAAFLHKWDVLAILLQVTVSENIHISDELYLFIRDWRR